MPVFRLEPLVMSEIEGVRTVGLVCASKYIIDIWRTSSTASTIHKWPLASFQGLTMVLIFGSRIDLTIDSFDFVFLFLYPSKGEPVVLVSVHRSCKFHHPIYYRTNYIEIYGTIFTISLHFIVSREKIFTTVKDVIP